MYDGIAYEELLKDPLFTEWWNTLDIRTDMGIEIRRSEDFEIREKAHARVTEPVINGIPECSWDPVCGLLPAGTLGRSAG